MPIQDALDVDFSVDVDDPDSGETMGRGWEEQSDEEMELAAGAMPTFEEAFPDKMVPERNRKEIALQNKKKYRATIGTRWSQSNSSACVGFGAAKSLEVTIYRRYGLWVPLAGMSVYNMIGRTYKSGAYIPDGMNQTAKVGALPMTHDQNAGLFDLTWDRMNWDKGMTSAPSNWEDMAAPFRAVRWAKARGPDEIESALLWGFTGIVGRSRHCIPYVYLDYDGNNPVACYANSWSMNWGDQGFGYDSRRTYRNLTMYLILDVVVPPSLVTVPSL